MWFNSLSFFWLLLSTLLLYYSFRSRSIQVTVLLLASGIFYGWAEPTLLLLLLASIMVNALTSYQVGVSQQHRVKIAWATSGVVVNLMLLGFFKYAGLLAELLGQFLQPGAALTLKHTLTLPLPIGISFYTFEGISLLVDTYTGKLRSLPTEKCSFWKHLADTALFVAFFPHLVAGPILKANHFLPQIKAKRWTAIPWGTVVRSVLSGYFLKCVIADNLKDHTFWLTYPYCMSLGSINGLVLTFGYAVQIFADFAGYSLIAIGLGALLGYELPANFNYPYLATTLRDFWRRWHISLSTWLRDYLYLPLGGNRNGSLRTYFNLFLVMLLGGLWHGAAWSYLVWGGYHGLGLAVERLVAQTMSQRIPVIRSSLLNTLLSLLKGSAVFLFVGFGWLLFKLTEIDHAWQFSCMLATSWKSYLNTNALAAVSLYSLPVVFMHILHLPSVHSRWMALSQRQSWIEDTALGAMFVALIINRGSSNEFIYFQF